MMDDVNIECDDNGNIIHYSSTNFDIWYKYYQNRNKKSVHYKKNNFEVWYEYDKNGNMIHYKDSYGNETSIEYNENGNMIHTKKSNGFESWVEYDEYGNGVYRDSNGVKMVLREELNYG